MQVISAAYCESFVIADDFSGPVGLVSLEFVSVYLDSNFWTVAGRMAKCGTVRAENE